MTRVEERGAKQMGDWLTDEWLGGQSEQNIVKCSGRHENMLSARREQRMSIERVCIRALGVSTLRRPV